MVLYQIVRYFKLRLSFISDSSKDIVQVLVAALIVESFTKETTNWNLVLWGVASSLLFWIVSLISYRIK